MYQEKKVELVLCLSAFMDTGVSDVKFVCKWKVDLWNISWTGTSLGTLTGSPLHSIYCLPPEPRMTHRSEVEKGRPRW